MKQKPFKPFKKSGAIKPFAVVDCETWGLGGKMAFGVLYDGKKFHIFKSRAEFYEIVEREKISMVYAHNMEFDSVKIRRANTYEKLKPGTQPIYAASSCIQLIDETGLIWRDSVALLKSSVDALGKNLGYKKLETPAKFIHPPKKELRTISRKDIKYCERDCEIVYLFLQKLFHLTKTQRLTIASTAMRYFQQNYLKRSYLKSPLHEIFMESYYGGRVEAFKLGRVNASVMDVNSLYPSVMENLIMPDFTNLIRRGKMKPELFKKIYLKKFEGLANITVRHPKRRVGLLPYRNGGKLLFPTGSFTGSYNFPEIRFFLENGGEIISVNYLIYSPKKITGFFSEYVRDLYELKNTSEGAEKMIYKYLLNSLYGKFGQNKFEKVQYLDDGELLNEVARLNTLGIDFEATALKSGVNYLRYTDKTPAENVNSIFSIASYITTEARIVLNKKLLEYENEVVYCDTDSIALVDTSNFTPSDRLGDWSPENYIITNVYGNKFYRTDRGLKLKGVPKYAEIKGKKFVYQKFIKSKEAVRTGKPVGTVETFKKQISFNYDKRQILKNGDTLPINI